MHWEVAFGCDFVEEVKQQFGGFLVIGFDLIGLVGKLGIQRNQDDNMDFIWVV